MLPLELLSPDLQRLAKINEYCDDIDRAMDCYGRTFGSFQADTFYQYVISFCILQIGGLSGGLSDEFRLSTSKNISWREMKAMRNIIVHGYGSIHLDVVWETIQCNIPALKAFCEEELAKAREE